MNVLLPLALTAAFVLAPLTRAQEAASRFDAAVISFHSQTAIHSLADLNDDGIMDGLGWWRKVSAGPEVELQGFLGQADGTFLPAWELTLPSIYTSKLEDVDWAMEVGRFDANPGDDFVVAFDAGVTAYSSGLSGSPTVYWQRDPADTSIVTSLVTADFDGDGLDDLALVLESAQIQIYFNTGTGFSLTTSYPFGESAVAAEVDSLPGADLVARSGYELRLLSVTASSVTVHDLFTLPWLSSNSIHEVPGDIDGDGDDDLVVFAETSEQYVVLRQGAPGVFAVETVLQGGPATKFADIDGDGDLDGVCCGGGTCPCSSENDMVSTYRISINDGTGNFATGWRLRGHGALRLAGAADVDGDGDVDLVAGRSIYYNRGFDGGEPHPLVTLYKSAWLVTRFGDVDEDGDLDAYRPSHLENHLNDGTGSTPTSEEPVRPELPPGAAWGVPRYVGDFDGDGDLDEVIVYTEMGANSGMRLLLNTGGGDFVDGGWAVLPGAQMGSGAAGNAGGIVADLDNDGDPDVVAGTSNSAFSKLEFWFNDGSGLFSLGFLKTGTNPLAVLDFDGDGYVDVLEQGMTIHYGSAAGTFVGVTDLVSSSFLPDRGAAIGDFDENGFPDVVTEVGWDITVWWNFGGGFFVEEEIQVGPGRHRDVVTADVDGDGHLDLIVNGLDTRYATVLLGDGAGNFNVSVNLALDVMALEDMDGDGDPDALSLGSMARNVRPSTEGGTRRQFGNSTAGTGGMSPKLGASGPFRVGETAEVRFVGGKGASFAMFLVSLEEVLLPNWPAPGLEGYTGPGATVRFAVLDGSANIPGSGSVRLPFVVPPSFQGLTFTLQGYLQDTGVIPWLVQTNGLSLHMD